MESACVGAWTKVKVSIPSRFSLNRRRNLLSGEWAPRILTGDAQRSISLRCVRDQEETMEPLLAQNHQNDELINTIEVREWESGKTVDDIAANQGIRIRRHPAREFDSPRNILEKIIWDKVIEVSELKKVKPLTLVKEAIEEAPPARDFLGALKSSYQRTGVPALIAEVKKASPSKGVLREDFDPVRVAKAYEQNGAACLSILTDAKYFQGSFENLEAVCKAGVKCPLLCKEFIIETWQLYYARAKGADAVLLIAAVLPDLDIKLMTMICKELGLTALIESLAGSLANAGAWRQLQFFQESFFSGEAFRELLSMKAFKADLLVHDEREMDRVLGIDGVQLIGINNRDLGTFEVDISNTKRLLEGERGEIICKKDITVVGESGLFTPEDISYVQNAGVKAVLVGESLIKKSDPGKAIAGLFGKDISE